MVTDIAKFASQLNGDMWHIHDFYFLHAAKKWVRKSKSAVLYDVHEYYGQYYAGKIPVPSFFKDSLSGIIEKYQVRSAKVLGAANVVAEEMAAPFRTKGVPVTVSPNYPLLSHFADLPSIPFKERRWKVLHIGTLTRSYGTELLIELAARSLQRRLPFEFSVIERFPSPNHAHDFEELLLAAGNPRNISLIPPRPTHEIPGLLKESGFGLSLLKADGQNEVAVASKLYEHVMAGMAVVVTSRKAQRDFASKFAVGVSVASDDSDAILDAMIRIAENPNQTDIALAEKATIARDHFTWERAVEPGVRKILRVLKNNK
ncbi:glycosyltransferase [Glutamicibacter nicotianae]|uniref:glycosyltransferase n=1 Tax=Glutamicibacter nicotianae TaxID=37929 RepID=UPI0025552381|nr:glycosyltransferase [Glutamicibacter nicotianae]WIV45290.1 glycosyltransferase [Glutamicibacter nicotianae]